MSLLNIGLRGLSAAQGELSTTSHNIANVNTPGYSRQEAILSTATPQFSGGGYFGRGVDITTVRRQYDQFLGTAVQSGAARASADSIRSDSLAQLDKLFADSQQGIGAALDDVFSAAVDLASQPADPSARQVFLSRNDQFAQRLTAIGQQLDQLGRSTEAQLTQSIGQVNSQLSEINRINSQIAQFQATGHDPNDLLDQRDQMLQSLNQLMGVTAVSANDGTINLFAANGVPLLVGNQQSQLVAVPDPTNASQLSVQLKQGGTNSQPLEGGDLGGRIGGLFRFRDGDLRSVINQIGKLAVVAGDKINAQQALGVDASGNPGKPIFTVPAPVSVANMNNTGNGQISATVSNSAVLEASDYKIDYDGSNYTITRLSDGMVTTAPIFPATVDGLRFDAVGSISAGNSYLVQPFAAASRGLSARPLLARDVATAQAATVEPAPTNHGSGVIQKFDVVRQTSDTTLPVTLTFNDPPTTFNVTGLASGDVSNVPYTPGQPIPASPADYNGWALTLDGAVSAGDSFSIRKTQNPSTNNGNALALSTIADAKLSAGFTLNETFAQTLGDIGTRVQGARDTATVSGNLLSEAQSRQQTVSGVNLDEEAANLLRYQQAYQASAKIIQASQQLFDTLLAAVGH